MSNLKRTPTKLKILKGNPGRRKLNKDEPQYSKLEEAPPDSLCEIGRGEWNRIVGEMRASGVLTVADEKILWCYCSEYATAEQAVMELKGQSLILESPKGYPFQNPYLNIKRKSFLIMKTLATELGLTPSSRSRVSATPAKPDDPYKQLKEARAARLATVQANLKAGRKPPKIKVKRKPKKLKSEKKPGDPHES